MDSHWTSPKIYVPYFLVGISLLIGMLLGWYFGFDKGFEKGVRSLPSETPTGVYCTLDAKLCPDGSSVGRTPPSCEFAPCPSM